MKHDAYICSKLLDRKWLLVKNIENENCNYHKLNEILNGHTFGSGFTGDAEDVELVKIEAVVLTGACSVNEDDIWDVLSGGEKLSELAGPGMVCEGSGMVEALSKHRLLKYWLSNALILNGEAEESGYDNAFLLRLAIVSTPFPTVNIKNLLMALKL